MPKHMPQVALIDLLPAIPAVVEMTLFADQVTAVQLAEDWWAEIG